jgi:flagellar hook-associated protein 3 FlgL
MRLSTNTIHEQGVNAMLKQQEALLHVQQQVSTGRRVLTPADDPIAAALALDITQTSAINTQFSENRTTAASQLGFAEGVLDGITNLIQNVQTAAVSAGNATFTDADRLSVARELRGRFNELVGFANSTDATGQFLFSGYQSDTKPFNQTATGVQYNGDQGERLVQIGASRQIATNSSGTDLFERIKNGNGVFATTANPTNTGSGVIDTGIVVSPANLTGDNYQISFTVAAGVTTYDVTDTTTGAVLSAGNPYTSDEAISFDGIQFSIKGEPANGDQFNVSPSSNQSLFKTIDDLINVLSTPVTGQPGGGAQLTNGLNSALQDLGNSLDHVLTERASVGVRLQEIEVLQSVGEDTEIQLQQNLSELQDVDIAKAISDLNQQRVFLEAAQRSFATVSDLSLFDFI